MTARLRTVPDAPLRALGLVRVSKIGDRNAEDLISPELQQIAIEDHCARRGYALQRPLIVGVDESGSRRKSKWWAKLDGAVEQLEAGAADVIVVWRFDRTARNRVRWAVALDRVEVAGGLLESATEPLDTSTASGRFARGMLAEMAAYRAEEIGGTWREVQARRVRSGRPANGKPRFGYRSVDGLHRPDPVEGPILAALYRRYVAGESFYGLVRWLNAEGIRTVPGYSRKGPGPWTDTGLRATLDSGFGAGLITVHGQRSTGAHEAVIDEQLWGAYLAARQARRDGRRRERSQYLLSGLVWCGVCGSRMSGGTHGRARAPKYVCIAARASGTHPGGYASATVVDEAVREWLAEVAGEVDSGADAALAQAARSARRRQDARALAREATAADKALMQLAVNQAAEATRMPEAVFTAARDELLAQRAALEARMLAAEADAAAGVPAVEAGELLAEWEMLPVEHRRGALRRLVGLVWVSPGRPRATARVVPVWEGGIR